MKTYIRFQMDELRKVVKALKEIQNSVGARFDHEVMRLIDTVASKKFNHSLRLNRDNLEKLSTELHTLELKHGIDLGQTIYYFMHSFHRR